MKNFSYTIKDKYGMHARPAGMLVKLAKEYKSEIEICKDGASVNATKLMALMGMNVKCGETVTININGEDEDAALTAVEKFFADNL